MDYRSTQTGDLLKHLLDSVTVFEKDTKKQHTPVPQTMQQQEEPDVNPEDYSVHDGDEAEVKRVEANKKDRKDAAREVKDEEVQDQGPVKKAKKEGKVPNLETDSEETLVKTLTESNQHWDAIVDKAETSKHYLPIVNMIAQVLNGGFDQWIENGHAQESGDVALSMITLLDFEGKDKIVGAVKSVLDSVDEYTEFIRKSEERGDEDGIEEFYAFWDEKDAVFYEHDDALIDSLADYMGVAGGATTEEGKVPDVDKDSEETVVKKLAESTSERITPGAEFGEIAAVLSGIARDWGIDFEFDRDDPEVDNQIERFIEVGSKSGVQFFDLSNGDILAVRDNPVQDQKESDGGSEIVPPDPDHDDDADHADDPGYSEDEGYEETLTVRAEESRALENAPAADNAQGSEYTVCEDCGKVYGVEESCSVCNTGQKYPRHGDSPLAEEGRNPGPEVFKAAGMRAASRGRRTPGGEETLRDDEYATIIADHRDIVGAFDQMAELLPKFGLYVAELASTEGSDMLGVAIGKRPWTPELLAQAEPRRGDDVGEGRVPDVNNDSEENIVKALTEADVNPQESFLDSYKDVCLKNNMIIVSDNESPLQVVDITAYPTGEVPMDQFVVSHIEKHVELLRGTAVAVGGDEGAPPPEIPDVGPDDDVEEAVTKEDYMGDEDEEQYTTIAVFNDEADADALAKKETGHVIPDKGAGTFKVVKKKDRFGV